MNEVQNKEVTQEQEENSGGLLQKVLDWTGISQGMEKAQSAQDNLERIKQAEEWINMPYKRRMEYTYMKGGKYGGNLKESEVGDPNSLRWFIYNLDGNDSKSIGVLQKKLNSFFEESGYDDLSKLPIDREFGQRTINRMNKFIEHYDKTYSASTDTHEALRAVRELLWHRENEFTTDKDTVNLKQRLQDFNPNEETTNIMKDLEMIPK